MFGTEGYHGASMDAIARRAGISKPVLYQHFESKADLYVAVVSRLGEEMIQEIQALGARPDPAEQRVREGS